jgi:uncharacterized protein YbjT (DUF2867 family)
MRGQDVVYANLAGDMARQASVIVEAMHAAGVKRLIFISSMGIYREVPGETYRSVLDPYRDSAALIEQSDLDYTILRPGWFTRKPEGSYRITQKGEPFQGHDISLDSLSALIARIVMTPDLYLRCSIGVSDG